MNLAVPKETAPGEKRVALTPSMVSSIIADGFSVTVQEGAGMQATFTDADYEKAGATIVTDAEELWRNAGVVLKVQKPNNDEIGWMTPGTVLVSFLWALSDPGLVGKLRDAGVTAVSMDALPRISRAQTMDALSAMSSLAGYKAVLLGANALGKYLPMMVTAAGTIPPARVLVLGAGVAGLQAIATARRLGAVVEAFDVRPTVKEQVESLGAAFIDIPAMNENTETSGGYARELTEETRKRQQEVLRGHIAKSDLVITTALVPGKPAPKLIREDVIGDMQAGSVIVDLAAEQGGNCELTHPGEDYLSNNGVLILGPLNIPSSMPLHASQLYSRTIRNLLRHLTRDGRIHLDFDDEITRHAVITHENCILSPLLSDTGPS